MTYSQLWELCAKSRERSWERRRALAETRRLRRELLRGLAFTLLILGVFVVVNLI